MKSSKIIVLVTCFLSILGCEEEEPHNSCIDKDKIRTGACTFEYNPVCGCDGKTYPNACAADLAGVTSWTEGECD